MKKNILYILICAISPIISVGLHAKMNYSTIENLVDNEISIDMAYGYLDNENYTEALKWFEIAAADGHQIAFLEIGDMYFFGLGVDVDYKKAVEYYNKSTIKNDGNVLYNLAEIAATGVDGSTPNGRKAENLFNKAVENKSLDALALRFKEDSAKLVTEPIMKKAYKNLKEKNYEASILLLEEAADIGNTDAMYELANYFSSIDTSLYEAYYWANLCFPYMRANCIDIYNNLWNNYSLEFKTAFTEDLFEPRELAIVIGDKFYETYNDDIALGWYLRAGDLGHIDGYYMAGLIYGFSEFVPLDYEKAQYYLKKAVAVGNENAQSALDDLEY